jgi:DNA-binding response OmpR family regulator
MCNSRSQALSAVCPPARKVAPPKRNRRRAYFNKYLWRLPIPRRRLLLVSANPTLRAAFAQQLGQQGYAVLTAANIEAAIALAAAHRIALILWHLPQTRAYGGWATYELLQQQTRKPVLVLADIPEHHSVAEVNAAAQQILQRYFACLALLLGR